MKIPRGTRGKQSTRRMASDPLPFGRMIYTGSKGQARTGPLSGEAAPPAVNSFVGKDYTGFCLNVKPFPGAARTGPITRKPHKKSRKPTKKPSPRRTRIGRNMHGVPHLKQKKNILPACPAVAVPVLKVMKN